jgi:hypothetical protein
LPTFIFSGNEKFQLDISENKSVSVFSTHTHKLLEIQATNPTGSPENSTNKVLYVTKNALTINNQLKNSKPRAQKNSV